MLNDGLQLASYPRIGLISARYGDLDADGFLSEMGMARYVEQARSQLLTEMIEECGINFRAGPLGMLVAHVGIRVVGPHAPDKEMRLGTGVSRMGRSSVSLRVGVFAGEDCVAVADNVMVFITRDSGRPVPVPDAVAQKLQAFVCR